MIRFRQILNLPDGGDTLQRALQGLVIEERCVILESAHLGESGSHLDTFHVDIDGESLDGLKGRLPGLHIEELATYHTT